MSTADFWNWMLFSLSYSTGFFFLSCHLHLLPWRWIF